ncbi:MAG: hypothetical protein A2W99_11650 [Bacteroidetes bacterium GWF2_33_16]|nr:MAG: hypothetical protein A2X00_02625 [Bacteroidetes bacterium GWE2_32_14]OFY06355.1 MAG: hypothetical protein A2W99_11650 [Bacteroidetes bacterium GWF2_33_16]
MQRYLLILFVIIVSCTAKKKAAEIEAQKPDWVKQKPYITGYYTGVAAVKKVGTSAEYIAKARQAALADMAEEISSNISSTSVLHTVETQYGKSETFDQRIEVSANDYFEGFEPVDYYETPDSYWVYFKINKSTYLEMKEKKKQEAIATALAKYQSGLQEHQVNKPKEAFSFYLQGLQAIKKYLNEETPIELNGKTVDIGNELYSAANQVLSLLEIKTDITEISVKRGSSYEKNINYWVLYKNKPVQGIPVEFSFTGKYLKKDRMTSDANGMVQFEPETIDSKNSKEQLSATINLKDLVQKAVDDPFIRGLILKRILKPTIIVVNILSPTVVLIIADNTCTGNDCERIQSLFSQNINQSGYKSGTKTDADFKVDLFYTIKPGESAGGLTSVYITGDLKITDKSNNIIWTRQTEAIKGVGRDNNEATNKAFNEFCNALDRRFFKQVLENIR